MPSSQTVSFAALRTADLIIDAVYEGGRAGNRGDDPLHPLMGVGNAGGFRLKGRKAVGGTRYGVLYTSGYDPDWPDLLDVETGVLTYHGDQKQPGRGLHDTPRSGNRFLREIFELAAQGPEGRAQVPPLFLFEKAERGRGTGTDVRFRGLLAPGAPSGRIDDQLIALWRSSKGSRFQNYRALFTVLNTPIVERSWISELDEGSATLESSPEAWAVWVKTGVYRALRAERTRSYRTPEEQVPSDTDDLAILTAIHDHFTGRYADFEACAASLWQMLAPAATITEITRPVVDGGRDALGYYSLGAAEDRVPLSFSLEAKCYAPGRTGVGTKDMSRLISRLRHREFGVMVTTSYVSKQAYLEIREDRHPIVVMCGADIVRLLRERGMGTRQAVGHWLDTEFPAAAP
jgi:hypothetical protein